MKFYIFAILPSSVYIEDVDDEKTSWVNWSSQSVYVLDDINIDATLNIFGTGNLESKFGELAGFCKKYLLSEVAVLGGTATASPNVFFYQLANHLHFTHSSLYCPLSLNPMIRLYPRNEDSAESINVYTFLESKLRMSNLNIGSSVSKMKFTALSPVFPIPLSAMSASILVIVLSIAK